VIRLRPIERIITMSLSATKAPTQVSPPKPPSVHARAVITWIAIFPLVTLGYFAIAPFGTDWSPVLRSFVLTVVVVPVAVYVVVPQLMRVYGKIRSAIRRTPR
jgi:antibiotic biosynthesis monooxygenase (ABM) superfamily enzyme